jgi:hypothetical protein
MNWQKQPNRNEHWLVGDIGGGMYEFVLGVCDRSIVIGHRE